MSDQKFDPGKDRSRRRSERAHVLNRLKGVFIKCDLLTKPEVRVVNISDTGIWIETSYLTSEAKVSKTLSAKIIVGKTVAPVTLKLARLGGQVSGFEFVSPSGILRGAIRVYFEAELVGASLKPVKETDDEEEKPRVLEFQDNKSNSLRIEVKEEQVKKFDIDILGNQIIWSESGELCLLQNSKPHPIGSFLRKQVVQFIRNADTIAPPYRKQMERVLMGV